MRQTRRRIDRVPTRELACLTLKGLAVQGARRLYDQHVNMELGMLRLEEPQHSEATYVLFVKLIYWFSLHVCMVKVK